ncbi:GIY-YIG nuclease family protein [Bosea sp. NPDC055594]
MSVLPYSADEIAQEVGEFAARITPSRARWEYCLSRASYPGKTPWGSETLYLDQRTLPVCDRIAGVNRGCAESRLRRLIQLGYDAAEADAAQRLSVNGKPFFAAGPLEAWHIGHVYFARLNGYPHIVKVGFSRRVRDRLDDIESKCKHPLSVRQGELFVGTMADEHMRHRNWRSSRISGEWFFDPASSDRSLPPFLTPAQKLKAA